MLRFFVRRLLWTLPVVFGVATLVFLLIHLIPGDPAQVMLGDAAPPEDVAALRHRLGLDRPLGIQYAAFLGGVVRGDFGQSMRTNQPVRQAIAERLPATIELAVAALVVAIVMGIPLGTVAAGDTRTITTTYQVPPGYAGADPIVNTATASAAVATPVRLNDAPTPRIAMTAGGRRNA